MLKEDLGEGGTGAGLVGGLRQLSEPTDKQLHTRWQGCCCFSSALPVYLKSLLESNLTKKGILSSTGQLSQVETVTKPGNFSLFKALHLLSCVVAGSS